MKKIGQILLIDDDRINNSINYKLLEKLNLCEEIKMYESAEVALEHLQTESAGPAKAPILIFLDLNMPGMDGFGFLEALKRVKLDAQQEISIVCLTVSEHASEFKRIRALGCNFFINKPLTQDKLFNILHLISPAEGHGI
jgi:CheY-like chemotaxis protein